MSLIYELFGRLV